MFDTRLMERASVTSSSIASVGYDANRSVLEVQFRNGSVYQYDQVTLSDYRALMAAKSKGAHFNLHVRDRYRYRRL